jgi:hypothetical protein
MVSAVEGNKCSIVKSVSGYYFFDEVRLLSTLTVYNIDKKGEKENIQL